MSIDLKSLLFLFSYVILQNVKLYWQ